MKIIGLAGWSGSGKTTLAERLIGLFRGRGLAASLIKHAHHEFEIDRPGKDSHRHRLAGAQEVLVSSARRWALIHELQGGPEVGLDALLARLAPCDLVLVEGYKRAPIPKIEVYRPELGKPLFFPDDRHIVALACPAGERVDCPLPRLDLDVPAAVAEFVIGHLGLGTGSGSPRRASFLSPSYDLSGV